MILDHQKIIGFVIWITVFCFLFLDDLRLKSERQGKGIRVNNWLKVGGWEVLNSLYHFSQKCWTELELKVILYIIMHWYRTWGRKQKIFKIFSVWPTLANRRDECTNWPSYQHSYLSIHGNFCASPTSFLKILHNWSYVLMFSLF